MKVWRQKVWTGYPTPVSVGQYFISRSSCSLAGSEFLACKEFTLSNNEFGLVRDITLASRNGSTGSSFAICPHKACMDHRMPETCTIRQAGAENSRESRSFVRFAGGGIFYTFSAEPRSQQVRLQPRETRQVPDLLSDFHNRYFLIWEALQFFILSAGSSVTRTREAESKYERLRVNSIRI